MAKINAKKSQLSAHEHSLGTVWEMSLRQLTDESSLLQKFLAFLDHDAIHETILTAAVAGSENSKFTFLSDEMEYASGRPRSSVLCANLVIRFLDAMEPLLRAALIEQNDEATIIVHRLIQSAVMNQLSPEERLDLQDYAVRLLLKGFPKRWDQDEGHQFSTWKSCENCLPHVNFMIKSVDKWKLEISDPQSFSDLVLRCCWYAVLRRDLNDRDFNDSQVPIRERELCSNPRYARDRHGEVSEQA